MLRSSSTSRIVPFIATIVRPGSHATSEDRSITFGASTGRVRTTSTPRKGNEKPLDVTAVTEAPPGPPYGADMVFRRRWPLASKAYLMLAVASGGTAFLLVRGQETRWATLHPSTGAPVNVWTASSDLARGTTLTVANLAERSMPSAFLPPGSFHSTDSISGRVLSSDVAGGEVLTRARVAGADVGPIAALVPPGLRAVIRPSGGPASAVRAGEQVDVLATY